MCVCVYVCVCLYRRTKDTYYYNETFTLEFKSLYLHDMHQFRYHITLFKETLLTTLETIDQKRQDFRRLVTILEHEKNDLIRNLKSVNKGITTLRRDVWPLIEDFVEASHAYLHHQGFNKSDIDKLSRY